jgi:hypothetical protein
MTHALFPKQLIIKYAIIRFSQVTNNVIVYMMLSKSVSKEKALRMLKSMFTEQFLNLVIQTIFFSLPQGTTSNS